MLPLDCVLLTYIMFFPNPAIKFASWDVTIKYSKLFQPEYKVVSLVPRPCPAFVACIMEKWQMAWNNCQVPQREAHNRAGTAGASGALV